MSKENEEEEEEETISLLQELCETNVHVYNDTLNVLECMFCGYQHRNWASDQAFRDNAHTADCLMKRATAYVATHRPQSKVRRGIISIPTLALEPLGDLIKQCDTQGMLQDKGVFARVHHQLLLPEHYTILGLYFNWHKNTWDIVVKSPELPVLRVGSPLPQLTLIYQRHEDGRTTLKEIKVE